MTEGFGATSYAYDSLGHMTSMTRSINGQSYSTAYTYDLAGEVLTETYPSGRTVRMLRDAAARITGIEAKGPGETLPMVIISILNMIRLTAQNLCAVQRTHLL